MPAHESRAPLIREPLEALLTFPGAAFDWPMPRLQGSVGSTNDLIAEAAEDGAAEGTCIVAEEQVAGRGRRGRTWVSPPGSGLWVSVLIRPGDIARERWSLLPLIAGMAARTALREVGVPADLKWPNDLVVVEGQGGEQAAVRKLGGILMQVTGPDACVIGTGINTSLTADEVPVPTATSVLLEGGRPDRSALLAAYLISLRGYLARWRANDSRLLAEYRASCASIGRQVEAHLPDGSVHVGIATGVDDDGHLVINVDGADVIVTAGDVVHATISS